MARKEPSLLDEDFEENIVDIDVQDEMEGAFLEYAYSVIYSRALPDARDGLKPVQRRILYGMRELGLRPDRGHVKSSRIVGEVMGKYHPHGDSAIYDALVRLAQPFTMRLPLIDGHGNFGSLDDGPAAARYTEARMSPAALPMVAGLDEDTVDFVPNYDDQLLQPGVLPAAYPNLLVNGASGIAVGMATNMAPHNLVEVVGAARHLLDHPDATLDDLMRFVPGPDLPGGGRIIGLDGIRDAYASGRGSFRTRATVRIENVTPRRKGIVVTELPYLVGPEKVTTKIKELVQAKKLQGIHDLVDLTDGEHGLHLVIELKNGFNPEAVLEKLYKLTPLEDSFGINNVALVEGQPRTLGLKEMLSVYVEFRLDVVRRRTQYRLDRALERLHLVEGLLIAILDIDEVIQLIRGSDDATTARARLMDVFDLSEAQATYILDLQLRRLTKFSRLELERERDELTERIEMLRRILGDDAVLRSVTSEELAEVAQELGTPRRTVLLESSGEKTTSAATPLEVGDDPCFVLLSSTGLLARTSDRSSFAADAPRAKHDDVAAAVPTTARGEVGLLTSTGRVVRLSVLELPTLPPTNGAATLAGGTPASVYVDFAKNEEPVTIIGLDEQAAARPGVALGTAHGVVKRVVPEYPAGRDEFEVITLKPGDAVVGARELATGTEELVFVTSDAQLLHFGADKVRPQGRPAGGVAGVKLGAKARVVHFGAYDPTDAGNVVVTVAGSAGGSANQAGSVKVTPLSEYPGKGRATGGVRAHRFIRGEDVLLGAYVGALPIRAAGKTGKALTLPTEFGRRDGSGVAAPGVIAGLAPGSATAMWTGATDTAGDASDTSGEGGASRGVNDAADAPATASGSPADRRVAGRVTGLAAGDVLPGFDEASTPRPRPQVDRDDYDPDSLDDVVQTGEE
ncbi:DNA gyrase/topoisomerase IV subunit A [Mobilicoccus massiliensis]|uniref:DNA gyrase/topoisomerase IV subunit A n=1 Tax=Mobilicoccus massiliensis TaxID=1522310 RepID=UPI00058B0EF4|nr:DNA topoisomerase (ATP-hydrolyzing) [Mobilicoccus massiliensis]